MTHDETSRPLTIGEGRISAYLSITLGALAILAVLCFRYPDWLTTPDLRASYDLAVLRVLLALGMGAAVFFGLLTFALGRCRLLGCLGLGLTAVALALGGAGVEVGPRADAPVFLGLDWMVLDLLASALALGAIEKLAPRRADQPILRPDFWHDARYFAFNHLGIGLSLFIGAALVPGLFSWTINEGVQGWFRDLPGVVQFLIILVTADLMEYALHRAMHEIPALWRIHAVHHSVEHMDWLAGSRLHLAEPLATRALVLLPGFVLGAEGAPLLAYITFAATQAGLNHANLGLKLGWVEKLLVTPRFHHWHHASDSVAVDTNYAAHLPLIDWLFRTHHMPKDGSWPAAYGVIGKKLPKGILRQFLYPFVPRWWPKKA